MADKHLRVGLLDIEKLVSVNDLQEVSNPVIFVKGSIPTPDGLLSNEIFGITRDDRANTFAYIDLGDWFINPLYYKTWTRVDKEVKNCVHGLKYYSIDKDGQLVEDEEKGETGINFLRKNMKKIKFKRTQSNRRDMNVDFLERYKDDPATFIKKYLVIPALYRDVDTSSSRVAVGELNELYRNVLISAKAIKESQGYGLNLDDSIRARIQEAIVSIYDYFGSGTTVKGNATGGLIPGKTGSLRMSVLSKTTDYGSRLVLSAPELKVETLDEVEATLDYSVVPLASVLTNFLPFIVFQVRTFFEANLGGDAVIPFTKGNKVEYLHPKDYQMEFSDDRIRKEIDRFCSGFSNRFIPIEVPVQEGGKTLIRFAGHTILDKNPEEIIKNNRADKMPLVDRNLTWCDVFYMAAVEATKDKHVTISRYPIDTYFNNIYTRIKVASTTRTEPMIVNEKYYAKYPYIRQEDIGKDTSNKFIDTMNMSNLHCPGMGADYDGDQITCRGLFSDEANEEAEKIMNSKANFINLGGRGVKESGNEAIQSLYSLTVCVSTDEKLMTDASNVF